MATRASIPKGCAKRRAGWSALRGFLELHIDQSRDLAPRGGRRASLPGSPPACASQAELTGRADHAGTTPREDRHDALAAAARLIVRADAEAAERLGMVFTASRLEVEPNAPTTVPSLARLWLDARAPVAEAVTSWREAVATEAERVAVEAAVGLDLRTAAWSEGAAFPDEVVEALAHALRPAPRGSSATRATTPA